MLSWINGLFHTDYKSLESASNGAVACQILDCIYPHSVPMKMVDFSAETPYACQKNYKIFQAAVNKLNLPIAVDVVTLSKQGARESYSFLALLKHFFDTHSNRSNSDTDQSSKYQENTNNSRSLDAWGSDKLLSPTSARQTSKSLDNLYSDNPVSPTIPSTEETLPNLYQRLMDAEGEKRQLMSEVRKLESLVERHESLRVTREKMLTQERNFYYCKLREVELLLQETNDVRELTKVEQEILEILYSRDGMEDDCEDEGERIEEGSTKVESTKIDVQA